MKTRLTATTVLAALVWLLPSLASAEIIGFEAESGGTPSGIGYRVQDDEENALGGQYIDSDHRSTDGGEFSVRRQYSIMLPAGTYDLWGRIYTPSEFSYDPAYNSDGGGGSPAYANDSFYVPEAFGTDPTFIRSNGYASAGKFDGTGGNASVIDAYAWINLTDNVDLNGFPGNMDSSNWAPTYISAGGTEIFTIKSREGGIRHDAFAFVSDDYTPTEEELNAAVPEPSTLALLTMATLALLAYAWRRRR